MKMAEDIGSIKFYFGESETNRKDLFKEALLQGNNGKVLYILPEELTKLPELSQDITVANRHAMKMISFLYAKSLELLIENVSTLAEWQNVPHCIILDSLDEYCSKEKIQNAFALVALLVDTALCCSTSGIKCHLVISVNKEHAGDEYCHSLKEIYNYS